PPRSAGRTLAAAIKRRPPDLKKTGFFEANRRRGHPARCVLGPIVRPPLPVRRDGDVQMWRRSRVKSLPPLATAGSLLLPAPMVAASPQQATSAKPPASTGKAPATTAAPSTGKATAAPPPLDGGWPRTYSTPSGGQLVLYQPQVASWDRQLHMGAYAAVSFLPKGADKGQLGPVKVESDTVVAVGERLVRFPKVKVTEATFATLDRDQLREVVTQITDGIPDHERVIALDRVLASVEKSQIIPRDVSGVKADPPAIFYS